MHHTFPFPTQLPFQTRHTLVSLGFAWSMRMEGNKLSRLRPHLQPDEQDIRRDCYAPTSLSQKYKLGSLGIKPVRSTFISATYRGNVHLFQTSLAYIKAQDVGLVSAVKSDGNVQSASSSYSSLADTTGYPSIECKLAGMVFASLSCNQIGSNIRSRSLSTMS